MIKIGKKIFACNFSEILYINSKLIKNNRKKRIRKSYVILYKNYIFFVLFIENLIKY